MLKTTSLSVIVTDRQLSVNVSGSIHRQTRIKLKLFEKGYTAFVGTKAWQKAVLRSSFRYRSIPVLRHPHSLFFSVFKNKNKEERAAPRVPSGIRRVLPSFFKSGVRLLIAFGRGHVPGGSMVVSVLSHLLRAYARAIFTCSFVTLEVTICHLSLERRTGR